MVGAVTDSQAIRQSITAAHQELENAMAGGDEHSICVANAALAKVREEASFTPRVEPSAAELFHRWEMQAAPPDLLITNVSMLSIMLMRHKHPRLDLDRADSQMFDQTRVWLDSHPDNVFQLVIDELHLYRGASGTEVAYLIRLLLERLGLKPGSPQLRILASSASMNPEEDRTYDFLSGFFGMTGEEAKQAFHIEAGQLEQGKLDSGAFSESATAECLRLGRELARGASEPDSSSAVEMLASES
jgi:ATP-dependent helicase YprA (DUF1998 family)